MSYAADLLTEEWAEKRAFIFERDNYTCRQCKGRGGKLHCHHKYYDPYDKSRKAWQYADSVLVTLCEECHRKFHESEKYFRENIQIRVLDKFPDYKAMYKFSELLKNPKIAELMEKLYFVGVEPTLDFLHKTAQQQSEEFKNLNNDKR